MKQDDRDEAIMAGIDAYVLAAKRRAEEGKASAADVKALMAILDRFGGAVDPDHPANVQTKDAVLDSLKDLDLTTIQ